MLAMLMFYALQYYVLIPKHKETEFFSKKVYTAVSNNGDHNIVTF